MISPKKSLGQNFLQDKKKLERIVETINPQAGEFIVEIGPGPGALTDYLIKSGANTIGIDVDPRVVNLLQEKYPKEQFPNFEVILKDFLTVNLQEFVKSISSERIKIVGNIPYNISSQIFFKIFENYELFSKSVLTVQKEVAQRVVAKEGNKTYGILSIAAGLVSEPKIALDIPPGCFFPKPKVTSSVIELLLRDESLCSDFKEIMKLVRAAFNQRRKKLSNSIAGYVQQNKINLEGKNQLSRFFDKRPEALSVTEFIELYDILKG